MLFLSKRISFLHSEISFQISSLIDASNNGQIKAFKAESELQGLVEENEKRQRLERKTERTNAGNHNGRRSAGARFLFW